MKIKQSKKGLFTGIVHVYRDNTDVTSILVSESIEGVKKLIATTIQNGIKEGHQV